jgi:hypothetical protein
MFVDLRICIMFLLETLKYFKYKGFLPMPIQKERKKHRK